MEKIIILLLIFVVIGVSIIFIACFSRKDKYNIKDSKLGSNSSSITPPLDDDKCDVLFWTPKCDARYAPGTWPDDIPKKGQAACDSLDASFTGVYYDCGKDPPDYNWYTAKYMCCKAPPPPPSPPIGPGFPWQTWKCDDVTNKCTQPGGTNKDYFGSLDDCKKGCIGPPSYYMCDSKTKTCYNSLTYRGKYLDKSICNDMCKTDCKDDGCNKMADLLLKYIAINMANGTATNKGYKCEYNNFLQSTIGTMLYNIIPDKYILPNRGLHFKIGWSGSDPSGICKYQLGCTVGLDEADNLHSIYLSRLQSAVITGNPIKTNKTETLTLFIGININGTVHAAGIDAGCGVDATCIGIGPGASGSIENVGFDIGLKEELNLKITIDVSYNNEKSCINLSNLKIVLPELLPYIISNGTGDAWVKILGFVPIPLPGVGGDIVDDLEKSTNIVDWINIIYSQFKSDIEGGLNNLVNDVCIPIPKGEF